MSVLTSKLQAADNVVQRRKPIHIRTSPSHPPERHPHLEDPLLPPLLDLKAHPLEEGHHRPVGDENLGGKVQEPLPFREVGEIMEELASDPLALEVVSYDQSHLGGVHIGVEAVLADADSRLLLALLLDDRQDQHVPRTADGQEHLPHLSGDVPPRRDEPGVEALIGEAVKELLDQRLVADFYGAEEDLLALACAGGPMDREILGVLAALAGDEGLVLVDQIQPLRLLDQPGLEVWVGDCDEVHRTLPDVLSLEVGDPTPRHRLLDVPAGQGHTRSGGEGGAVFSTRYAIFIQHTILKSLIEY